MERVSFLPSVVRRRGRNVMTIRLDDPVPETIVKGRRKLREPGSPALLQFQAQQEITRNQVRNSFKSVLRELKERTIYVDERFDADPYAFLWNIFITYRKRPFKIDIDGVMKSFALNEYSTTQGFDKFKRAFVRGSDEWIIANGSVLVVYTMKKVEGRRMTQAFAEGSEHCVLTPIRSMWEHSNSRQRKMVLERIDKWEKKTGNAPVPETQMEKLGVNLLTKIVIHDPMGKVYKTYNTAGKRVINFINACSNHVDKWMNEKKDAIEISQVEMKEMIRGFTRDKIPFICEGQTTDPYCVRTCDALYRARNPMKEYLKEISALVPNVSLNASAYPKINQFLLDHRIINAGTLKWKEEFDEHYDLEKAYSQFHISKYYIGFLGNIHQWRSFDVSPTMEWLNSHMGIYSGILDCSVPIARAVGLEDGKRYILGLPMWNFLVDIGCSFHITEGVFGSRFDFRFPDSAFTNVEMRDGSINKPFRIWSGQLSSKYTGNDRKYYSFACSEEFAPHVASLYPETHYDYELGMVQVSIPQENVRTRHHIFGFLTEYTRIIMMNEMLKFQIENLSAITLDGLYFTGLPPADLIPQFRPKPKETMGVGNTLWYSPCRSYDFPLINKFSNSTALLGPGGTGKTQIILGDLGFNEIVYVSPSHSLGQAKQKEFGVLYATIHRMLGEGCVAGESYKDMYGEPAVIFVDELTQIEGSWIDRLIRMYPNSLIFVAGDIDCDGKHYQTKYSNEIWVPKLPIVEFSVDYRSKTSELKEMKLKLREFMRGDVNQYDIRSYAVANYKIIPHDVAVSMYNSLEDTWIIGTHKFCKSLPSGIVGKTTHSIQGKTIVSGRIFISICDMFEYSMLYTAISRAVSHSQLIFVGN